MIPTRYPPVDVFRDVAPQESWDFLLEVEGRTNERLVDEEFRRGYVRPEDLIEKSSSHYILGPLTHPNPDASRFSDGTYGVVYGALDFETIVAEARFRREEFMRRTAEKPQRLDMRAIVIDLDGELHDLRGKFGSNYRDIKASQRLARELREAGSYGLVFDSETRDGGECVAVFRAPVLSNCRQERHLAFMWDGASVAEVLEYSSHAIDARPRAAS